IPASETVSSGAAWFSRLWQQGGWIGVDLFFVLSGFLVSGLLFREYDKYQSLDIRRFLVRRGFKIYPAFWAMIAATLAVDWFKFSAGPDHRLWSELLFVQNYSPGMWNHTWSLAVEEHFYLLLATILGLLVARRQLGQDPMRAIPLLFGVTALLCLSLRIVTSHFLPYHHSSHLFPTHLRIDSLMFGVLLAYGWQRGGWVTSAWIRQRASALIAGGLLLLFPAFVFPLESSAWIPVWGFICFYLGSGAILIGLLHRGLPQLWSVKAAAALGAYSYSVYLWHMPVHNWLVPACLAALPVAVQGNWFVYISLYLAGSFFVGVFMCRWIESPVLLLRDRWFPSRSQALARAAEEDSTEPHAPKPAEGALIYS
ncbi:MAG: acyltransferase, partial [Planctomycetales bacterium]|nr:acyltransferase [Planctomycetales bacterium]